MSNLVPKPLPSTQPSSGIAAGRIALLKCAVAMVWLTAGPAQAGDKSHHPTTMPASRPASAPSARPAPRRKNPPAGAETNDEVDEVEAAEVTIQQRPSAAEFWGEAYPRIDRGINLPLPNPVRRGALVLIVDHRTNQPVQQNTWHDYFGLDAGGLKIGLGLRFGILERLDAGIYRLNSATERFDLYEIDARYQVLTQPRHWLDLGLRGGVTWFSQQDADDAAGFLGQLLMARRLWDRLTLGTGLLFHSDSTNGVKASSDDDWSLATLLIIDLRILAWLTWTLEMGINLAGYGTRDKKDAEGNGLSSWPSFSSSVRFITNRHTFALVVTNNQYVSADGYISNTPRGFDRLIIGFTITREWNLW